MKNILVIEDSPEAYSLIHRAIGQQYSLIWAPSVRTALQKIERETFDLVLLDLVLSDGDGMTLCSILQTDPRFSDIPVIVLSSKCAVAEQLVAFAVGADDFVPKPFEPQELAARIGAKLRKKEIKKAESFSIQIGDIRLDQATRSVTTGFGDERQDVSVTSLEFKLLAFLARNKNKVLSRDEILDQVWGQQCHVFSRNVDTHISKLKKKLGRYGNYLASKHGVGYVFAAPEMMPLPDTSSIFTPTQLQEVESMVSREASEAPIPSMPQVPPPPPNRDLNTRMSQSIELNLPHSTRLNTSASF